MDSVIDFILDTNILIYLSNLDEKYIRYIEDLSSFKLGISIISYTEVLVGLNSDEERILFKGFLNSFEVVEFSKEIANITVQYLSSRNAKGLRNPKFQDTAIAATAIYNGAALITNNPKDFKTFNALEVKIVK